MASCEEPCLKHSALRTRERLQNLCFLGRRGPATSGDRCAPSEDYPRSSTPALKTMFTENVRAGMPPYLMPYSDQWVLKGKRPNSLKRPKDGLIEGRGR